MKKYEPNELDNLNNSKRAKFQSTDYRIKKPISLDFEFKSSLFTEKNKSLIEKLISQHISQDSSFSKEEINEEPKRKMKLHKKKALSMLKAKMIKSVNTSLRENKNKDYDMKTDKKFGIKNNLVNKNNSSISIQNRDKDKMISITNCKIKSIHKHYLNISKKPIANPQKNIQIQTVKNNIEEKKIIFNGICKNINKNKTRNNPELQNPKKNSNLNSSVKTTFRRKKLGNNTIGNNIQNKIIKNKNLRNSVDNRYNNLNIITVNTVHLNNRKKMEITNNNYFKKKKFNNLNAFLSPKYRNTIHYK